MWERELRKIKGLYDNRLRASQQKSSKMEQALTNQTYQVTIKNKSMWFFFLSFYFYTKHLELFERKTKGGNEYRLRASQQKSSKMEQALTNQTYQVTIKNKSIWFSFVSQDQCFKHLQCCLGFLQKRYNHKSPLHNFVVLNPETLEETIESDPLCIIDLFQNKSVATVSDLLHKSPHCW